MEEQVRSGNCKRWRAEKKHALFRKVGRAAIGVLVAYLLKRAVMSRIPAGTTSSTLPGKVVIPVEP